MLDKRNDNNMANKIKIAAPWIIIIVVSISGCRNDIAVVNSLTLKDKSPVEIREGVHFFISKEGVVDQEFLTKKMNRYDQPERYLVCPDGFEVIAYRADKTKRISLKADYGVHYEDRKIMEAKRNVVITNFTTGEIIETEQLIWDQNKKIIYSNRPIKQTLPDGSVYIGERFESNEDMSKYTIIKPHIVKYDDGE